MSTVAHWLGLGGELANLAGATILALDLFLREREKVHEERLIKLHDWAVRFRIGAFFDGLSISDKHFLASALGRRATRMAFVGWGFLVIGFGLLTAYHVVEINQG